MKKNISKNILENSIEICLEKFFNNNSYNKNAVAIFSERISKTMVNGDNYKYSNPIVAVWKIFSDCNLRCKHCFFYNKPDKFNSINDFNTEQAIKLIDDLIEMNIVKIILSGGETLLRKDIFKILKKIKSNNIAIKLSTNATLVNEEIAKELGIILNQNTDIIQVSLDGANAETHDLTRGKGSFSKTIRGIKSLINNNNLVSINCTITSNNVSEISDLYRLAQSLEVPILSISKIIPFDTEQELLIPNNDLFFYELAKAIEIEKRDSKTFLQIETMWIYDFVNNKIAKSILDKNINLKKLSYNQDCMCHKNDKIYINANGDVHLCHLLVDEPSLCLGNAKKRALSKIWQDRFNNIFFQERNLKNMTCKSCNYVVLCKGGCPASAYLNYGDLNAPDKNCIYGKCLMQNTN